MPSKYRKWLEDVAAIRKWDVNEMLNDETYNYERFYNSNRTDALDMLNKKSEAHFNDIGKTVYHPTFSTESGYSGYKNKFNPKGVIGGRWSDIDRPWRRGGRYTLSNSQIRNSWDIPRTIDYLGFAEDNGVELRLPNGNKPYIDGAYFDAVMPAITVTAKRKTK